VTSFADLYTVVGIPSSESMVRQVTDRTSLCFGSLINGVTRSFHNYAKQHEAVAKSAVIANLIQNLW